jgi:hypothetical protein
MAATELIAWGLRVVTAAALVVDAVVHNDLVHRYAPNRSGGLSQGQLFRIEAVVALLAALLVLLTARWFAWAFAFTVSASAVAAVLISTNYDIGSIGPIPDMYEPIWYGKKTLAAVAESVGAAAALAGFALRVLRAVQGRRAVAASMTSAASARARCAGPSAPSAAVDP